MVPFSFAGETFDATPGGGFVATYAQRFQAQPGAQHLEPTTLHARRFDAAGQRVGFVTLYNQRLNLGREYEIRPAPDRLPGLLFGEVGEPKVGKNLLHLDLRPDDRDAEVERLLALGATRVDVGQGDSPWTVLADPEGNEFCVLSARTL